MHVGAGRSPTASQTLHRPTDLDDGVDKLEVQPAVAGLVADALSDSELEKTTDAVEIGVHPRNLGERLCIECAFQASAHEASSEHLCPRVAGLPGEGIEPNEIVLVDTE
jgi:hypothetical protein